MDRDQLHLLLRRLHSLTGIVPIGAYVLAHILLENSFVLGGAERFNQFVAAIGSLPAPVLLTAEILFIWGPLLFHGLYGLVILRSADVPNALHYDYPNSLLYVLQRVTGVLALLFVGFHVYTTRIAFYFFHTEITYNFMHSWMSSPLWFTVYLVGVLASVFHFSNGIWTFCITWGITVGAKSQRYLQYASAAMFIFVGAASVAILAAFR